MLHFRTWHARAVLPPKSLDRGASYAAGARADAKVTLNPQAIE